MVCSMRGADNNLAGCFVNPSSCCVRLDPSMWGPTSRHPAVQRMRSKASWSTGIITSKIVPSQSIVSHVRRVLGHLILQLMPKRRSPLVVLELSDAFFGQTRERVQRQREQNDIVSLLCHVPPLSHGLYQLGCWCGT